MDKNKGFTLIELLVVIAIIGILASVVLASLNTARGKGANASIKSNLNNIRAQAEIVYDDEDGSYNTVCNATQNTNIKKAVDAAHSASGATGLVVNTLATLQVITTSNCHSSSAGYAISVPLKTREGTNKYYWCIDHTGTSAGRTSALAASSIVCPAS